MYKRKWRENKSAKGPSLTGTDTAPLPASFPRNESDPLTAASHALHTRHI